jgi:peptide/nickel transport system substrate-binding protein
MKHTRLIALLLALLMLLGAIPAQAEAKTSVVVGAAAEPNAFFVCHSTKGTNMDEVPIIHNIYDSLIKRNVDGSYEGLLATEWSVSEDGLAYTLKIRQGVKFSDGSDMTVDDVVFSMNYIASTKGGQTQLTNYDRCEKVDDQTAVIYLTSPFGGFINALCNRYALIFSKAYFEKVGEDGYDAAPVGTGPYKFVEYVSGDHITLAANEYYWGEKPAITDITFRVMTDVNTQMIALENGEIDVLLNANITPLMQLDPNGKVTYKTTSAATYSNLQFNLKPGQPTADLNLRLAIAYAINKEEVNIGTNEGLAEIGDIMMPFFFNARPAPGTYKTIEYNLDKAKEYLAKSTYKGEEVKIVTVSGTKAETACQIIQGQLINLGINCTLAAVDAPTYNDYVQNSGDYCMNQRASSSSLMDSDCLYFTWNKNNLSVNFDRGLAPELDDKLTELTAAGRAEPNPDKRVQIYTEACDLITDNGLATCLYYDLNVVAFNKDLKGVEPGALVGMYYFNDWSW